MTFSRPTSLAKRRSRSAISSGCSTILLAWVMTPGMSTLPSGTLTRSKRWYSCSCRGLAASKLNEPGVDLKYVVDDLRQACLLEPRALVDAIARVEAHTLPRNPLDRGVSCPDIEVGAPLHLLLGEARFVKDVRQERIVDLEQEAGRDRTQRVLQDRGRVLPRR